MRESESPDFTSTIDSHILSWEVILKDLDQATKAKLKEAMAKTEKDNKELINLQAVFSP